MSALSSGGFWLKVLWVISLAFLAFAAAKFMQAMRGWDATVQATEAEAPPEIITHWEPPPVPAPDATAPPPYPFVGREATREEAQKAQMEGLRRQIRDNPGDDLTLTEERVKKLEQDGAMVW
jgi:hypothetical protein